MSSIYLDSVAKPAEPRPSGGGARGTVRDCDTVEISVGALRHLCDIVEYAMADVDNANAHMARVHVSDPSDVDGLVAARAWVLCAGDNVAKIQSALRSCIPGEES